MTAGDLRPLVERRIARLTLRGPARRVRVERAGAWRWIRGRARGRGGHVAPDHGRRSADDAGPARPRKRPTLPKHRRGFVLSATRSRRSSSRTATPTPLSSRRCGCRKATDADKAGTPRRHRRRDAARRPRFHSKPCAAASRRCAAPSSLPRTAIATPATDTAAGVELLLAGLRSAGPERRRQHRSVSDAAFVSRVAEERTRACGRRRRRRTPGTGTVRDQARLKSPVHPSRFSVRQFVFTFGSLSEVFAREPEHEPRTENEET